MTIDPVSLAITAALTAAQMGLAATQKIEGPRLDDLSVTVADYGTPLNYFYGIRRFEGVPIIWAEPLKEVKKKQKTKGGKYNEYTYYGTWAIAIANHEIDAVTRIWFDKHLVYDVTGTGPISPFSLKKGFGIAEHIRFYLGTEDQMPDPRMLATVEAEHGAGSCPAYRGTAYAVFEEIPLEKLGNRIPQITIEAVGVASPALPYETHYAQTYNPERLWGFTYSSDGSRVIWGISNAYEVWDLATRSPIMWGSFDDSFGGPTIGDTFGLSASGSVYLICSGTNLCSIANEGAGAASLVATVSSGGGVQALDVNGVEVVCIQSGTSNWELSIFSPAGLSVTDTTELSAYFRPDAYFVDLYGSLWCVGSRPSVFGGFCIYRVIDSGALPGSPGFAWVETGDGNQLSHVAGYHYKNAAVDHFVIGWNSGTLLTIDISTLTVTSTRAFAIDVYNGQKQFKNVVPGAPSIWLDGTEISSVDLTTIRSVNLNDWAATGAAGIIYDPVNHALISALTLSDIVRWNYLDRISADVVTLGDIADDVAARCDLPVGSYDFSALDQEIAGYNWTQGSGRDIIDPLFTAYDSDIAPHDFTVRGVKRGGSSSGTIDVGQFVRDPDRYKVSITQDTDLPRSLTFSFADTGAEQQTNSVLVQRPSVAIDGVRELNINMTSLALSVDDARKLAERYFRRIWAGREKIENAVTAQYLSLEPADVKTLTLDGISRTARMLEQTLTAGGVIKARWERDDPNIALLSGAVGAAMDGRAPSVMLVPGLTRGFVLDVPLARDIDDQASPFLVIAAGPYSSSGYWSGAEFYMSEDGSADSYDSGWATIGPLDACSWGYATDALGDALPWVPDNGNSLNIRLSTGELESVSDSEFDASETLNLALVESADGWEYVRFRTATLEGDGSWTISGFLRGCRGTEQHISGHALGDRFLLVDSTLAKRAMGASDIGDTDYYKPVSQGRDETSAYAEAVAFSAAAQKPYAPVHGELTLDGSGDWSIDAVRRTRIGGGNIDGSDVPLGETAESWACDVMDGADVARTITGSSLPLAYSSADQTTDFGSPQTSLTVNLYQVSPALSLRGFGLEISA